MRMTRPRWAVVGYVLTYTLAQVVFAFRTDFHLAVNDFLGLVAIADHIDWSQPATLHNGFFPFALPAIVALSPAGSELAVAGLLSAAFGAIALLAAAAVTERLAGAWWAVGAAVIVSANPLFFLYFASPGPDIIATGLAALGLAVYAREAGRADASPRLGILFTAGLLFGVAGLFRFHAAVLGVGLLVWVACRPDRRVVRLAAAALGIVVGYLPQVALNLAGGFGPFESDSAFTMYQSIVPIDWHATGAIDPAEYASPLGVILARPFEFANTYLASLNRYLLPVAVVAVATMLQRRRRTSFVMFSMLVSAVVFVAVVSTGNSPRGLLPLLPLVGAAAMVIAARAVDVTRAYAPTWQRTIAVVVLLGFVAVLPGAAEAATFAQNKKNAEASRAAVEAGVVATGLVDDARQLLTNDFDLYMADLPGIAPEMIGGWTAISRNGREPHIDVDLSSVPAFYCDARDRGIRVVLWYPGTVTGLDPELETALNGNSRTPLLRTVGNIGGYIATEVVPDALTCG